MAYNLVNPTFTTVSAYRNFKDSPEVVEILDPARSKRTDNSVYYVPLNIVASLPAAIIDKL